MPTSDDTEDMEGLDSSKDREPVWEDDYDYWPYPSPKKRQRSKIYMSRTGKRGGGFLAGGPGQRMRRGRIDSGSVGGGQENEDENTSRMGREGGQKQFMIRMGKRGGHNKIMKRENNWERMTKRDCLWGRIL